MKQGAANTHPPTTGKPLARAAWLLPWLALVVALCWLAWPQIMQRGCWMGQWPFENGCAATPRGSASNNPPSVYLAHLQRNAGDSRAWVWLARHWRQQGNAGADALQPLLLQLAPNDEYTLLAQADAQLAAQDWDGAAHTLITLVGRGRGRGSAAARPVLVELMQSPATRASVLRQLGPDSTWLDPLLARLDRDVPAAALQPFISRGSALGLVKPATVIGLIDRLQRDNAWLDAHALWVAWLGSVPTGLYNPGFDRPALLRGFDWRWQQPPASKRGFHVEQITAAPQAGLMLQVDFAGHAALPQRIIWQDMILPRQRYRLRGRYKTSHLLTREGLVWGLHCAAGGKRWTQTPAITAANSNWTDFELTFSPPPECGAAVRLQLQTTAPGEARAGLMGTVYFDDFSVTAEPSASAATADTDNHPLD